MKTAKAVLTAALVAAMPAITATAEVPKPDVVTRLQVFMPQRAEDWDGGSGVELQARFWANESFATALSIGFASWTAKSEFSEASDEAGYMSTFISGDVDITPVGVSAIYRNNVSDRVAIVFEMGLRYLFMESNISAEITTDDGYDTSYLKDRILTDSAFVGLLGVNLENEIVDGIRFHLGVGYQFDITETRETFGGQDMGTTSLDSPMVNVGLTWAF
ncbi:MAG: hypothetical protein WCL44_01330 [bacterium]